MGQPTGSLAQARASFQYGLPWRVVKHPQSSRAAGSASGVHSPARSSETDDAAIIRRAPDVAAIYEGGAEAAKERPTT